MLWGLMHKQVLQQKMHERGCRYSKAGLNISGRAGALAAVCPIRPVRAELYLSSPLHSSSGCCKSSS